MRTQDVDQWIKLTQQTIRALTDGDEIGPCFVCGVMLVYGPEQERVEILLAYGMPTMGWHIRCDSPAFAVQRERFLIAYENTNGDIVQALSVFALPEPQEQG